MKKAVPLATYKYTSSFPRVFAGRMRKLELGEAMDEIIFSKILTPTDVKVRLSFPSATLTRDHFRLDEGAKTRDFQIMDYKDGQLRTFRLYTRKCGHPKPVLTSGWIDFVNNRHLRVGDKVIFYVQHNGNGGHQLKIRAQRCVIKLLGEECWIDI